MLDPFQVCNLDIFRSSKMKFEEQNNSVFEKHGRITTSGVPRCVVMTCKIHKYMASSRVRSFNNLIRLVVERRFRLLFGTKSLYFKKYKRETFNLPCSFLTYSIRFVWDSGHRLRSK